LSVLWLGLNLFRQEKSVLSEGRLFQILQHDQQRTCALHCCCRRANTVSIDIQGCCCFHIAERKLTDLCLREQRSVHTQISDNSELFLIPNFLVVVQSVVLTICEIIRHWQSLIKSSLYFLELFNILYQKRIPCNGTVLQARTNVCIKRPN